MNTRDITATLDTLFRELVDGASERGAYVLNGGDPGLLGSLDRLTASDASASSAGGATVAAHVDHVRYGLSLMNRWRDGENPFADADWSASWRIGRVSDDDWRDLRTALRGEAHRWRETLGKPRDVDAIALNGMVGSIAHVAYHLGAIRQISAATRGPKEGEQGSA